MANKSLFKSANSIRPRTDAFNEAGGRAYKFEAKHALAQMAATGCFNGVYYASAESQLAELRTLVGQVDDNEFLAKLAIYARRNAGMKDMPAALIVELAQRDTQLMHQVFDRVVDNGRILRTVFQLVRSGRFGRKGLSSSLKRAFQRWLNNATLSQLLSASIGRDPSLRDILRMARPTPRDNARRALFGWLTDKDVDRWAPASFEDLPVLVQTLIAYRHAESPEMQSLLIADLAVRWDLLADAALDGTVWKAIARQMGPQALRMNLNTMLRHGVFADPKMVSYVAGRIGDADEVQRSRQFPYQYLAAYKHASTEIPYEIRSALHQAAELACGNTPTLDGPVVIGLDTSGSMSSSATGWRGRGATSRMRCVDVAALFAAAVVRRNPDSVVIPFDTRTYRANIDPADSILSIADRLSQFGGGGTNCALPLDAANTEYRDRVFRGGVLVSDAESWVGAPRGWSTGVMSEWAKFVANQKRLGSMHPRLVCIDIQPYTTTQAPDRADVLNVGGFSDAVFRVVAAFLNEEEGRFVNDVESVRLTT